jgi:DNA polymerase I-like protein with 3'-5' exonuclease and polymerase domains
VDRELVTIHTHETSATPHTLTLLTPRPTPPRSGPTYLCLAEASDLPTILTDAARSEYLVVDLETRGSDYSIPGHVGIVGVGLAYSTGSVYLHWDEYTPLQQLQILNRIYSHPRLVAHNVYYDGGVLYELSKREGPVLSTGEDGKHPKWYLCTLSTYQFLANEGHAGQSHGLKSAMVDVLQWENSNETELDEWLVVNGYHTGPIPEDATPEEKLVRYREGKLRPDKAEMWRAPRDVLGKYCVLDAEATYLLLTEHLLPILSQFPQLHQFLREYWIPLTLLHIEQRIAGIPVDRDGLSARIAVLSEQITQYTEQFTTHPDVAPHIAAMEEVMLRRLQEKEPTQYLQLPDPPREPPRYRKDGGQSLAWENWTQRMHAYEEQCRNPTLSQNWVKWDQKWQQAQRGELPEYRVNLQSGPQMAELLYTRMGFPVQLYTEGGFPATGGKALRSMGEVGRILTERGYAEKELGYVTDYLERTEWRDTLHPQFRLPGPCTGRLSSSRPNLQQVPKTRAVMQCFTARPGHVWVDIDYAALESVVAGELSGDPALAELYAEGKPENDIHLVIAASVPGPMGEAVRATGYRPVNPPPGSVSRAKKECKHQRSIAKTVVYACQFGAGVGKVHETLELDGIEISYEEVELIHSTYWRTFSRLREYGRELEQEWRRNGGYVLNGFGRPMCVPEDYRKDLLSRVVQSTGHDILAQYISMYTQELTRRCIPWKPLIIDWHDATTVEVPEEYASEVADVMLEVLSQQNQLLGCVLPLRGKPVIGRNLAEVKEAEGE